MSASTFNVTLADVTSYDWEATLTAAERPVCAVYDRLLFKKSGELAQTGDERGQRVYRFLGAVASLALKTDDDGSPFGPSIIWESRRSAALEDFGPEELDVLAGLLPKTRDAAMCARFGDVLWATRKDHKAAKVAAESYLDSFKRLDVAKDWPWDIEFLRRGFTLARFLGKRNEPFPSYVKFIEGVVSAQASSETGALCARMMEMLLEHEVGDFLRHAATSEQIAENVEADANYFLAQQYLRIAARLYAAGKNEEAGRQARLKKGQSLVRQAQDVINKPGQGYMTGSHFLAMGIECLRQAQAPEETTERLHKLLREWQEASLKEMQTFSQEMDISDAVEAARKHVRGKPLVEAILAFALGHPLIKRPELRERIIKNAGQAPLTHLMGASFMSHDGRVLAHKPPTISLGKDVDEAAIEAEMISQARNTDWPLRVSAYIEPGRLEIFQEHRPSHRDLAFLFEHNPLIPPGHEVLFLRGIHAGFHGDMMLCAHLLIPRVEEAIRYVLRRSGVVTSKLDSKLIQEERLLGVLLAMPETIQIFGEDCTFELRGILCEKLGFDLRNRFAHGFLTAHECFGADVFLTWWLVLRMCAFPVYQALHQPPATAAPSGTGTTETRQTKPENPPPE